MKHIFSSKHTLLISAKELVDILNEKYNIKITEPYNFRQGSDTVTLEWADSIEEPVISVGLPENRDDGRIN